MAYQYKIFGYDVQSEIEIDAHETQFDSAPDVVIERREIELPNQEEGQYGFWFSNIDASIKMNIPEVGAYMISNGDTIHVQPRAGATPAEIQLFLLGSSFGFLMHQRKEFPLHGSAIDLGETSIVLVGHSGAGKSSLASGFVERGYTLLTDDVARVTRDADTGVYTVHPSYPSQKIWKDAVEQLEIEYDENNRIMNRMDKFIVNAKERFSVTPRALAGIVEIMPGDVGAPFVVRLEGKERLNALIAHSYRQEMMGPYTDLGAHLRWCSGLVGRVPVYRVYRPRVGFTVSEQVGALMAYVVPKGTGA